MINAINDGFLSPTLPKQPGKPTYRSIQDTLCLLTTNAASIESPHTWGQNGHFGISPTTRHYTLVSRDPFICRIDTGRTPSILAWKIPFNKKTLLCEHFEQSQQYVEFRNVDAALHNQLLNAFKDTYLPPPLNNIFTSYFGATALTLLSHIYAHSTRISGTNLAENDRKLHNA